MYICCSPEPTTLGFCCPSLYPGSPRLQDLFQIPFLARYFVCSVRLPTAAYSLVLVRLSLCLPILWAKGPA